MRKLATSPTFFIIFTIFSLLFSFSLWRTSQKSHVSEKNIDELEQEITEIAAANTKIQEQVAEAETPLAKEKILRNELLLQKEGEQVVQITTQQEYVPPPTQTEDPPSPWEEWKAVLF